MEVAWCASHGLPHSQFLAWDADDRAKLVAHLLEESARCNTCGTIPAEWEEDQYAYEAVTITCHGCMVREAANENAPDLPGTKVTLVPALTAERIRSAPKVMPGRR